MKATLYLNNKFCAMIGTWDPPLNEFNEMINDLTAYCNLNQLCPLVILMNPNPSIFYAEKYYRDYLDVYARIEHLNTLGIRNYLIMEFKKQDIDASAKDFFFELDTVVSIKELWLGGLQSFGTGENGSQEEIINQCSLRNIRIRILEKTLKIKIGRSKVYKHFINADFEKTKEMTGLFPTFNKDLSDTLNFYDGEYYILNTPVPFTDAVVSKHIIKIANGKIEQLNELKYPWVTILKRQK